ncbi:hypothetical protein BC829DRAFT_249709 [Chytridium lagenaria]|nr:hypothetical protein BC829DRAFT_249709 [Chytridium lagenaria]
MMSHLRRCLLCFLWGDVDVWGGEIEYCYARRLVPFEPFVRGAFPASPFLNSIKTYFGAMTFYLSIALYSRKPAPLPHFCPLTMTDPWLRLFILVCKNASLEMGMLYSLRFSM